MIRTLIRIWRAAFPPKPVRLPGCYPWAQARPCFTIRDDAAWAKANSEIRRDIIRALGDVTPGIVPDDWDEIFAKGAPAFAAIPVVSVQSPDEQGKCQS